MITLSVRRRILAVTAAVAALVGLQLAAGAGPASAEPSQITFVTASPVQTAFGGNWSVQLSTRFSALATLPIPSDQATVDVFLSGINTAFATHLPIQPDGSVYVSQSATTPLAPGDYQMTAQLVPVTGSYVEGSQTTTPLVLTISAYAVDARLSVDAASVAAGEPVVEAALSGQFVDTTGAVPAGTWAFTVTSRGATVLETEVAQDAGAKDALRYAITEKLAKGQDFEVSGKFTPVDALAAGLEVTQPSDVTFHTPDGSLADPIPYPLWLLIVTCLVPLLLAATVIVLTVLIGKRRTAVPAGPLQRAIDLPQTPVSGSPIEPPGDWDPFATATATAPAEALPPTQVLPPAAPGAFTELITPSAPPAVPPTQPGASGGWSLSDETEPDENDLR
jgi:hypothetical protein